jgi:hypothetical protein
MITVLFKDGVRLRLERHDYLGACFIGDPTVYVSRYGKLVWVKPGESVDWIEA